MNAAKVARNPARCGDMDSETSKAAYNLLHNRFPRNPWTSKTPKWF
jgi:hypothetical protein